MERDTQEKSRRIQELTARAVALENQAKKGGVKAGKTKRARIAKANARLIGESTTRFRQKPDYENPRSRRVQLLLRQDLHAAAREHGQAAGMSFNTLVDVALREYLKRRGAAL